MIFFRLAEKKLIKKRPYVHAKRRWQQKGLCHFVVVSVDFTEAHTPK